MSSHATKFQIPPEEHADQEAHQGAIYAIQIRGNHMVTASADRTIRRWNLDTGHLIPPVIEGSDLTKFSSSVICVQFDDSPDQDVIIAGSADGTIFVGRFSTGAAKMPLLQAHEETVLSVHFDNSFLVSGGKDKDVKIWSRRPIKDSSSLPQWLQPDPSEDVEEYKLLGKLSIHHAAVNSVLIHKDVIISGSGDRKIHINSLATGEIIHSVPQERGIADMHYNGRFLLIGCSDNTATLYDTKDQTVTTRLRGHRNLIRAVDAENDESDGFARVVTGSYDGTVRIWEKSNSQTTADGDLQHYEQPWVIKSTFEYGIQPEIISDQNPYIHHYVDGERVFDVSLQGDTLFCSGQGNVVVGWKISS